MDKQDRQDLGSGMNHGLHGWGEFLRCRDAERRGLTTDPASPESYGRTGWPSILILIVILILIEKSTAWRRN